MRDLVLGPGVPRLCCVDGIVKCGSRRGRQWWGSVRNRDSCSRDIVNDAIWSGGCNLMYCSCRSLAHASDVHFVLAIQSSEAESDCLIRNKSISKA